jgi:hypothetical protein
VASVGCATSVEEMRNARPTAPEGGPIDVTNSVRDVTSSPLLPGAGRGPVLQEIPLPLRERVIAQRAIGAQRT